MNFAHRNDLPHLLVTRGLVGLGVEVGVQRGDYSATILRGWPGVLYSVDPWQVGGAEYADIANVSQPEQDAIYAEAVAQLAAFGARSIIMRGTSLDGARVIPDGLDFVYLDARHDFASVTDDLHAWYPKVRPGGILAGHDYIDGTFRVGVFAVERAVDAFCSTRGLRVQATQDDVPWRSWIVEVPA